MTQESMNINYTIGLSSVIDRGVFDHTNVTHMPLPIQWEWHLVYGDVTTHEQPRKRGKLWLGKD